MDLEVSKWKNIFGCPIFVLVLRYAYTGANQVGKAYDGGTCLGRVLRKAWATNTALINKVFEASSVFFYHSYYHIKGLESTLHTQLSLKSHDKSPQYEIE